jgi:hypothetical protein
MPAMRPASHKPDITQHTEVLRHDGLSEMEPVDQLTDRCVSCRQGVKKAPAARVAHGVEHIA